MVLVMPVLSRSVCMLVRKILGPKNVYLSSIDVQHPCYKIIELYTCHILFAFIFIL